jgi:dolichyl-phosphate beta-glucosyltransferase
VVIPAFNEAARLPGTLARIQAYLGARGAQSEILVVDDGSEDGTAEAARRADGNVAVLSHRPNRGKGFAVRRGMLAARGARRLVTDADLSTPIEELDRLWRRMDEGFDVVAGSRAAPGARVLVHQPWYRELSGRFFNRLVRALVLPGFRDTQCGFKLFSARAAEAAFAAARLDGFCFDVEVLYLARRRGLRVAEEGVIWRNDAATRVGLWSGLRAFPDLVRIRWHSWRGSYL